MSDNTSIIDRIQKIYQEMIAWIQDKFSSCQEINTDSIICYSLILLLVLAILLIVNHIRKKNQQTTKNTPVVQDYKQQEFNNKITLALVLKGKEAAKIPQTLKQSDLESLLKNSSYFLCASQLTIRDIVKKKLNLGKEETIDSNSDNQQVLVRIHFNHSLSLPQAFRNKLDLHDFFTKGNSSNITIEKNPLIKNPSTKRTGLGQAGFIR